MLDDLTAGYFLTLKSAGVMILLAIEEVNVSAGLIVLIL
jgi:hypothetical protein